MKKRSETHTLRAADVPP